MSLSAQPMNQAREALLEAAREKVGLLRAVKEQARKISDLEREVQRQASARAQAERALTDSRNEVKALRAQLPDDATVRAFQDLEQYLSAPSESNPELRIAA